MKINFKENQAFFKNETNDINFVDITEQDIENLLSWVVENEPKSLNDFTCRYEEVRGKEQKIKSPSEKIAVTILEEIKKLIKKINENIKEKD